MVMLDRWGFAGALVLAVGLIACGPAPSPPVISSATAAAPTLGAPSLDPSIAPSEPTPTILPVETPSETALAAH